MSSNIKIPNNEIFLNYVQYLLNRFRNNELAKKVLYESIEKLKEYNITDKIKMLIEIEKLLNKKLNNKFNSILPNSKLYTIKEEKVRFKNSAPTAKELYNKLNKLIKKNKSFKKNKTFKLNKQSLTFKRAFKY